MKTPRFFYKVALILFVGIFMGCSKSDEVTKYGLTTSINGSEGGAITPASGTFDSGTSVTLTAIPDAGYVFDAWGGSASGSTNPLKITMGANTQVTATFKKADTDNDGIFDDVDECPNTEAGATVTASGCVVVENEAGGVTEEDTDGDVDEENTTDEDTTEEETDEDNTDVGGGGNSVPVEDNTPDAEADADNDGVIDADDNCADTPQGETVDAEGCSASQKDADGDGVFDDADTCTNTPDGENADELGCSISQRDSDGDGVFDNADTCDNTPEGETADASGCSISQRDSDGDGVFDDADTCDDTPNGASVDATGCSDSQKDTDDDGVNDDVDGCPNTAAGVAVGDDGCEVVVQRTFIPNDFFEQTLIDLGLDDVLDDFVDTESIANVERLELGELLAIDDQSDDLTGIEAFVGLKNLTLLSLTVDELDFSSHPSLESIRFSQCRIDDLIIQNVPNLIEISFDSDGTVGNLNFSNNPRAERIRLFDALWGTAVISSNPRLTSIADGDNHGGGSTRITNNQSLTEINWANGSFADTVFADNANLTTVTIFSVATRSLDISQNPSITSLNLGETTFESLDLSNNDNILNFSISHDPGFRVNHQLLSCIKVNQQQIDNVPDTWSKEDTMDFAVNCP